MHNILKVKDKLDVNRIEIPKIFNLPFSLLISAKSGLGKSTILVNLLLRDSFYKQYFLPENIYYVSPNKLDNKMKIIIDELDIPSENIFNRFDEEEMNELYNVLEEDAETDLKTGSKITRKIIIMDDLAYTSALKKGKVMNRILMNGRHINLSVIICTQKVSLLSTGIRSNISGAILFKTNLSEVETIENSFNYLDSKKQFIKMYHEATKEPRSFLVLNFSNSDKDGLYLDSNFNKINVD